MPPLPALLGPAVLAAEPAAAAVPSADDKGDTTAIEPDSVDGWVGLAAAVPPKPSRAAVSAPLAGGGEVVVEEELPGGPANVNK